MSVPFPATPAGIRLRLAIAATSAILALILSACQQSTPEPVIPLATADAGHRLYVAKCAKCHKLYDPAKYSDPEWSKWMTKMTKKARLTPEQSSLISTYVSENLREAKP